MAALALAPCEARKLSNCYAMTDLIVGYKMKQWENYAVFSLLIHPHLRES